MYRDILQNATSDVEHIVHLQAATLPHIYVRPVSIGLILNTYASCIRFADRDPKYTTRNELQLFVVINTPMLQWLYDTYCEQIWTVCFHRKNIFTDAQRFSAK